MSTTGEMPSSGLRGALPMAVGSSLGLPIAWQAFHSREVIMKSISFTPIALAISIAALLVAPGCATDKPPAARTPLGPTVVTTTTTTTKVEPTGGSIAISDEIRAACGIRAEDAFFAFDSAVIASTDVAPLDAVARCFTTGPLAGRSMRLIGHADSRGPSDYNMTLGQHRADSVEGYLDRRGLQRSRMATTSRGAMDATGQDEGGWARDRRVDVQLGA
jgi:peptidoglycan-associated lipoprotein